MLDFLPCLLVNFDRKQLLSQYPEMIKFENYVPDGWAGDYRDFTPEIPEDLKYWIVYGHNLFDHEYNPLFLHNKESKRFIASQDSP